MYEWADLINFALIHNVVTVLFSPVFFVSVQVFITDPLKPSQLLKGSNIKSIYILENSEATAIISLSYFGWYIIDV